MALAFETFIIQKAYCNHRANHQLTLKQCKANMLSKHTTLAYAVGGVVLTCLRCSRNRISFPKHARRSPPAHGRLHVRSLF